MLLPVRIEDGKFVIANTLYEPLAFKKVTQEGLSFILNNISNPEEKDAFERALKELISEYKETQGNPPKRVVRAYGNFLTKLHTFNSIKLEFTDGSTYLLTKKDINSYGKVPDEIRAVALAYIRLMRFTFGGGMDYEALMRCNSRVLKSGFYERYVEPKSGWSGTYRTLLDRVRTGREQVNKKGFLSDICVIDTETHCPLLFNIDINYNKYYLVTYMVDPDKELPNGPDIIEGLNGIGLPYTIAMGHALGTETLIKYLEAGLYPPISEDRFSKVYQQIQKYNSLDRFSTVYQSLELWYKKYNWDKIKLTNGTLNLKAIYDSSIEVASMKGVMSIFADSTNHYIIDANGIFHGELDESNVESQDETTLVDLRDAKELGLLSIRPNKKKVYLLSNNLKTVTAGYIKVSMRHLMNTQYSFNFLLLPMGISTINALLNNGTTSEKINFIIPLKFWLQERERFISLCQYICKLHSSLTDRNVCFTFDPEFDCKTPFYDREQAYIVDENLQLVLRPVARSEDTNKITNLDFDSGLLSSKNELLRLARNTLIYWLLNYIGADIFDGEEHEFALSDVHLGFVDRYRNRLPGVYINSLRRITVIQDKYYANIGFKTASPLLDCASKYMIVWLDTLLNNYWENEEDDESKQIHQTLLRLCKMYANIPMHNVESPVQNYKFCHMIISKLRVDEKARVFKWREEINLSEPYRDLLKLFEKGVGYLS